MLTGKKTRMIESIFDNHGVQDSYSIKAYGRRLKVVGCYSKILIKHGILKEFVALPHRSFF